MTQSKYLQVALDAVKKAEKVILENYSQKIEYIRKTDNSPVTIADTEAEKVIIKKIKSAFPDHGIIAEESGEKKSKREYNWIIDPIDGTKNFTRGIPLFATQIALLENDEIILGVSNAPALKELIYAEKDKGAYLNGKKIQVSKVANLSDAYLCFGGFEHFYKKGSLDKLLKSIDSTMGHRGIGDFWCYHLLAQGKIDIMIEAKTKIWDIAAQTLIIKEAGGMVTNIKGNEVTRNTTSIIATNGKLHQKILEIFK